MTSRNLPVLEISRKKERRVGMTSRNLPVLDIFRRKGGFGMTSRFLPVDVYQSWIYLERRKGGTQL
jgi:hypothetical protein